MRRYESVWVVNGDLPDEEAKAIIDKFSRIITSQGGVLVGVEDWGRKKLAYKIQGTLRGYYVAADFAGEPATVKELERNYRIDDRIIRYLTIKKADHIDPAALQEEIAARSKSHQVGELEGAAQPEGVSESEAVESAAEGAALSPQDSSLVESATASLPQED